MVAVKRLIKFNYFQIQYKDLKTNKIYDFDINLLIEKIDGKDLVNLTKDYYQEKARLDKFWYNSEKNYWFFNFTRLRDTNIPSKAYTNRESEAIVLASDEFISEECNAMYDCALEVLMLQRNIHSLSVSGLEKYLNSIVDNPSIWVTLTPIPSKDIFAKIDNAQYYRKLTIKFSDIKNKHIRTRNHSSLERIFDFCRIHDGIAGEITISIGRAKNDTLNIEETNNTLQEIIDNRDIISKALMSVKIDDDKVNVIDLFEDVTHDYIEAVLEKRTSLASQYVENLMYEKFTYRKGDLYEILHE